MFGCKIAGTLQYTGYQLLLASTYRCDNLKRCRNHEFFSEFMVILSSNDLSYLSSLDALE